MLCSSICCCGAGLLPAAHVILLQLPFIPSAVCQLRSFFIIQREFISIFMSHISYFRMYTWNATMLCSAKDITTFCMFGAALGMGWTFGWHRSLSSHRNLMYVCIHALYKCTLWLCARAEMDMMENVRKDELPENGSVGRCSFEAQALRKGKELSKVLLLAARMPK